MGNGVRGPPAALTTDLHSFTDDQQRSWCLLSLAEVGEDRFARSMLRASDGNPFDVSTPESAVGDLRELVESAGMPSTRRSGSSLATMRARSEWSCPRSSRRIAPRARFSTWPSGPPGATRDSVRICTGLGCNDWRSAVR